MIAYTCCAYLQNNCSVLCFSSLSGRIARAREVRQCFKGRPWVSFKQRSEKAAGDDKMSKHSTRISNILPNHLASRTCWNYLARIDRFKEPHEFSAMNFHRESAYDLNLFRVLICFPCVAVGGKGTVGDARQRTAVSARLESKARPEITLDLHPLGETKACRNNATPYRRFLCLRRRQRKRAAASCLSRGLQVSNIHIYE